MNPLRFLPLGLTLLFAGNLRAEEPEQRAKRITVTMTLTDVPPDAAVHFVEVISNIKVHYQGHPGVPALLSVSFENVAADEALKYIASLATLELTYQADGAYFTPRK